MPKKLPKRLQLKPLEATLLRMYSRKQIKYIHVPFMKHPSTGKTIKMTTLNLSPSEQSIFGNLYNRGFITGIALGRGKVTEEGKFALKHYKGKFPKVSRRLPPTFIK